MEVTIGRGEVGLAGGTATWQSDKVLIVFFFLQCTLNCDLETVDEEQKRDYLVFDQDLLCT